MSENNTIQGIKACVFDAYGTLFDVHSAVGKHRHRLGDIIFQSSNAWDASGASAFGFKVAWVNRFGQSKERLPGQPDVEIRNLIELPKLLK